MTNARCPTLRPEPAPRPLGTHSRPAPGGRDASVLSTAALLSVVLGTGQGGAEAEALAATLLNAYGGLRGLAAASEDDLIAAALPGLGPAGAARLTAALELGRRLLREHGPEPVFVRGPADVADLLMGEMALLPQEVMRAVLLDTRSRVIGTPLVHQGSLHAVPVRVAEMFREAIRRNARSLIAVHNHPSGTPEPSADDIVVTRELVTAGDLLDIPLRDHIVIGAEGFVSMRERGLGFA